MDTEMRRTVAVCWVLAIIGIVGIILAATADDTSGMLIMLGSK